MKRHTTAPDGVNPDDFRVPRTLYFPYTEEEKKDEVVYVYYKPSVNHESAR